MPGAPEDVPRYDEEDMTVMESSDSTTELKSANVAGYGRHTLRARNTLVGVPEDTRQDLESFVVPGAEEEAPEIDNELKYQNIWVAGGPLQFLNDLHMLLRHLMRALDEEGLQKGLASPHEKEYIAKHVGLDLQKQVVNMLVFRRSNMKVIVVIMIIGTLHLTYVTWLEWWAALAVYARPDMEVDFAAWGVQREQAGLPSAFTDYSVAIAGEIQRLMTGNANFVVALGNTIEALTNIVAVLLVFAALWNWHNFRFSRNRLLGAWIFALVGPFVSSILPARLFVDWRKGERITSVYTQEALSVTQLEDRMQQLRRGCYIVMTEQGEQRVDSAENTVKNICNIIYKRVPNGNVTIPTSVTFTRWKTIDFSFAHGSCDQANRLIQQNLAMGALQQLRGACGGLKEAFGDGIMNLNAAQAETMANQLSQFVGYAAETGICLMLSLQGFLTMFPVALSIAPGMLKGALRMKLLVPQSSIPGMFVLMLPWMYAPVAWCYYSVFFQIIGGLFLLLGLLLIALHPVLYSVLGMKFGLNEPLTDSGVLQTVRKLNQVVLSVIILGVVFLILYILLMLRGYASSKDYWGYWGESEAIGEAPIDWSQQVERDIWKSMFEETDKYALISDVLHKVSLILLAVLQKYFLTAIAGFDWMNAQMLKYRVAETRGLGGGADPKFERIQKEYTNRIDQLVMLETALEKTDRD